MNYAEINKRLNTVRREMHAETPNYWQSRIDKMIEVFPDKTKPVYLYVPEEVIELIGWNYRGIEMLQIRPLQDTMYLTDKNIFIN